MENYLPRSGSDFSWELPGSDFRGSDRGLADSTTGGGGARTPTPRSIKANTHLEKNIFKKVKQNFLIIYTKIAATNLIFANSDQKKIQDYSKTIF